MHRWFILALMKKKTIQIRPGLVLLSEPFMIDPYFKRSVILICEHSDIDGSIGFVLNRSLDMKVCDTIVGMENIGSNLFYGGPVAKDTMHYLHRYGDLLEGSMQVAKGIWWGGDYEQLSSKLNTGEINENGIRFYLGYSGWGPGQLQDEFGTNSWLTSSIKSDYLFNTESELLWKKVLEDKGGKYKQVINYPEDPKLN